ncbi:hypothetical protein MHYP_G00277670 [Metynnis hypsauchen]
MRTAFKVDTSQMNTKGEKRQYSSPVSTGAGSKRHCPIPGKADAMIYIGIAKKMMTKVDTQLTDQHTNLMKLIEYVRDNISKLEKRGIKKKTTVGVFGKTGAGKSSLINAILGEKHLLPSGTLSACTSVIIQVEANISDLNYKAEIEFISKEEWKDELKRLLKDLTDDSEERDSAMYRTAKQKIAALYGKETVSKNLENLMKDDHFTGIPEFLRSKPKMITCDKATDFSDEIRCYVQHDDSSPGRCYWPVVKSVTIKVPKSEDFLKNIVLVDLPGTGDYNKSRDQMWRSKLKDCSTVWIVSTTDRAVSDSNAWEIVSRSIRDMAQGGECRSITFICTKTDDIDPEEYMRLKKLKDEDFRITPQDSQYKDKRKNECILHRNDVAKEDVKRGFKEQHQIKRHLKCDDDLSVFTVSSKEFFNKDGILTEEETEIPKLKNLLRTYNNNHTNERASQYISGAHGILSLIQGSKTSDTEMMAEKTRLYKELEKNLEDKLENLRENCRQIRSSLGEHLSKGARVSEVKCVATTKEIIMNYTDGRGFHRTLAALCENDGVYRSKNGETRNLNMSLIKPMLDHIDETFNDFFPVQGNVTEESLHANIDRFTIIPKSLITKYRKSPVLSHMLKFLQTEEEKLKTELKLEIVEQKKEIYETLLKSISTTMQQCYQNAAAISGKGSMNKKQDILLKHIESSKSEMFQKAKTEMLDELYETLNHTMKKIRKTLMESMEYSLCSASTLPYMDVSKEIEKMEELKRFTKD